MADGTDLAQIYASLGLSNPTATANDLSSFQNNVLSTDPWNIAAKSIGGWQPDMRQWSPVEQGVASFGKNFLAAIMGQYARNEASDQLNSVIQVMPELRSDPMSVMTPEGVDESAFGTLKSNSVLKNLEARAAVAAENKSALGDLLKAVVGEKAKTDPEGAIAGLAKYQKTGNIGDILGAAGASDPLANPNSPAYKVGQDKITTEKDLSNAFLKLAENYKYKEEGMKALVAAYADKGGTSDYELIRRGAQAVEKGLAVRTDDIESIKGAASVLGMSFATVKAAITGETKLSDDVRAGVMRVAQRSLDASLQDYNTMRETYLTKAQNAGLKQELVVPYGPGKSFKESYPSLDISLGAAGPGASTSGVTVAQVQNIIATAKAKYGDTPEGKAAAELEIRLLRQPRSPGGTPYG